MRTYAGTGAEKVQACNDFCQCLKCDARWLPGVRPVEQQLVGSRGVDQQSVAMDLQRNANNESDDGWCEKYCDLLKSEVCMEAVEPAIEVDN